MKIDMHCHSKYSHDNYLEPKTVIERALSLKLDGICFTEHYSVEASLPIEKLQKPDGFLLLRGVEISTDRGHLLAYGLKNDDWNIWSRNNYLNAAEVIKIVHDLGGICVPAHPYRGWDSFGDEVYTLDGFDAIETHNGQNMVQEDEKAIEAARVQNLPSIGGSDCHNKAQVGRAYTQFEDVIKTMDDIVREIKNGKCKGVKPL